MPKSRKRQSRRQPHPRGGPGAARCAAPGDHSGVDPALKALITEEVLDELWLSLEAEAAGDVGAAIEHFERYPLAESAPHLRYLHEVRDLGAEGPGWVWSRWIVQQASRWLMLSQDQRLKDALFVTLGSVYRDVDPERPLGRDPHVFVGEVMAMDWMCRQLALYEMGGLRDYLDAMVLPPLLRRADRIMAWSAARMSGFRVAEAAGGSATLTDLATGARREALNIGWLAEGVGLCVVGRLVPMRCEPGWIFESRPRPVSDVVAEEVGRQAAAERSLAWAEVLGDAVQDGELDWPLETLACLSPLSSDLLPYMWSAPHGEVAEAAYEVLEASLKAAAHGGRWATRAAPYAGSVLVSSQIYEAAKERLAEPVHADGWQALAGNTHEPVRSRCLALLERSRAAA